MGSRKKRATFNNIVTLLKNQLSEGEIRSTFGLLGEHSTKVTAVTLVTTITMVTKFTMVTTWLLW